MRTAKSVTRALLVLAVTASSIAMVPGSTSASDAAAGNIYYVAPNGNDGAAGTQAAPWATIARAQAVDVTAVLVFGAVVTALLSGAADGATVDPVGVALVSAGATLVALVALRRDATRVAPS